MTTQPGEPWHPTVRERGWERPVAVPPSLAELAGPVRGVVSLPNRLSWSGRSGGRSYDLEREHDRRLLYELVLTEGRIDDVCRYVNGEELVRLWPRLWLSPHVRRVWEPLILAATAA